MDDPPTLRQYYDSGLHPDIMTLYLPISFHIMSQKSPQLPPEKTRLAARHTIYLLSNLTSLQNPNGEILLEGDECGSHP